VIAAFISYILSKTTKNPSVHSKVSQLFSNNANSPHVGWIINERLINMPAEISPQMIHFLQEEIQWAIDDVKYNSFFLLFFPLNFDLSFH